MFRRCSRQTSALQLKRDGINTAADTASNANAKLTVMLQKSPLSYVGYAQPSSPLVTSSYYSNLLPLDQFELARHAAGQDVPSAYTAPANPS